MSFIKHHKTGETYTPKNPDKYRGQLPIIIRSGWERSFCRWLDGNPKVIKWGSEEIAIRYRDPINPIDKTGKPKFRNYYPDFIVQFENGSVWLVEIKPHKETKQPIRTKGKSPKTVLTEEKTWMVNKAKWQAAENFCKLKGWHFKILTEKELFS